MSAGSIRRGCCDCLRSELQCSRIGLYHDNTGAFVYSPWLPLKRKWQWLYLVYRWVVAIYFLAWFVVVIVNASHSIKAKYLIYLTNWGFIVWNAYLLVAAVSVTIKYRLLPGTTKTKLKSPSRYSSLDIATDHSQLTWLDKLHWLLFTLGTEFAVSVTILYWSLFYDPDSDHNLFSVDSLHIHLINGIVAVFEVWSTAIPVRLYHIIYVILFASCYILFTLVYFIAHGTDPDGNRFIYPFLNYESNFGIAVGVAFSAVFIYTTLIHLLFFAQYMCRKWITGVFRRYLCHGKSWNMEENGTRSHYVILIETNSPK